MTLGYWWVPLNFLCVKCLVLAIKSTVGEGRTQKLLLRRRGQGLPYTLFYGFGSTIKSPPSQHSLKHSGTGVVGLFLLWGIQIFKVYQWGQRPAVEMLLIRASSSPRVEVNKGLLVACKILPGNDVAFGVDCVLPIRGVKRRPLEEQRGVLHATTKIFARAQRKLSAVPENQNFTTKLIASSLRLRFKLPLPFSYVRDDPCQTVSL